MILSIIFWVLLGSAILWFVLVDAMFIIWSLNKIYTMVFGKSKATKSE